MAPTPVRHVAIAALVGAGIYLAHAAVAFNFLIDDTLISMRYAKHLAEHGQLVWNLGETAKVEGYSSPLWVLLCAALMRTVSGDPLTAVKVMGAVFGTLAVAAAPWLAFRVTRDVLAAWVAALLTAFSGSMIRWGVSGMESPLYVLLVVLALGCVVREEEKGLSVMAPLLLALVALARTEGVVFYGGVAALRLVQGLRGDARYAVRSRRFIVWNLTVLVPLTAYAAWKLWYYGSLVPLPTLVKRAAGLEGVGYVALFLLQMLPMVVLAVMGWRRVPALRSQAAPVWAALAAYTAAIAAANPIMGWFQRLLLAAVPLLAVLAAIGIADVARRPSRPGARLGRGMGLTLLCAAFQLIHPVRHYQFLAYGFHLDFMKDVHIPMGHWLKEQSRTKPGMLVAVGDAGAIPFYSEAATIDVLGLNDIEIARNGFSADRVMRAEPDYIVLKSQSETTFRGTNSELGRVSDALYAHPDFARQYRHVRTFAHTGRMFYICWLFERTTPPAARRAS